MLKIGAIIKELCTRNQFTQDALATAIGVTPQTISRWETDAEGSLRYTSEGRAGMDNHEIDLFIPVTFLEIRSLLR